MKEPALPTLTDRTRCPKPENISAWVIWDMKRLGALEPGFKDEFEGEDSLGKAIFKIEAFPDVVIIKIGNHVQPLAVSYTMCGKGGRRPWWNCPACGARRGVIFLRARNWGCRGCMGLPYRSQRMSRLERAKAKADRLRTLLGDMGSLLDDKPLVRPHGMRWRTFQRRRKELDRTLMLISELILQAQLRFIGRDGPPLVGKDWHSRVREDRIGPKHDLTSPNPPAQSGPVAAPTVGNGEMPYPEASSVEPEPGERTHQRWLKAQTATNVEDIIRQLDEHRAVLGEPPWPDKARLRELLGKYTLEQQRTMLVAAIDLGKPTLSKSVLPPAELEAGAGA